MSEQGNNQTDEKNKTIKIAVDEITKENVTLKETVAALTKENETLRANMLETNAFLDSQVRAKMSADLRRISKFSVEDIQHMTTEDLATTLNTLQHSSIIKKPMVPGKPETDTSDEHFTVGNLFGTPLRPKQEAG